MGKKKKKKEKEEALPEAPDVEITEEELEEWKRLMSPEQKTFLHMFLTRWRNKTLDEVKAKLLGGWEGWSNFVKSEQRAEALQKSANLKLAALAALSKEPTERNRRDVKTAITWIKQVGMLMVAFRQTQRCANASTPHAPIHFITPLSTHPSHHAGQAPRS